MPKQILNIITPKSSTTISTNKDKSIIPSLKIILLILNNNKTISESATKLTPHVPFYEDSNNIKN